MAEEIKLDSDPEFREALKEFETQSELQESRKPIANSQAQKKEVEGVQFEADTYKAIKFYNQTNVPQIVQRLMKYSGGIIKNEKSAYQILFGFVIIAVVISLYLFLGLGDSRPIPSSKDFILTPPPKLLPIN